MDTSQWQSFDNEAGSSLGLSNPSAAPHTAPFLATDLTSAAALATIPAAASAAAAAAAVSAATGVHGPTSTMVPESGGWVTFDDRPDGSQGLQTSTLKMTAHSQGSMGHHRAACLAAGVGTMSIHAAPQSYAAPPAMHSSAVQQSPDSSCIMPNPSAAPPATHSSALQPPPTTSFTMPNPSHPYAVHPATESSTYAAATAAIPSPPHMPKPAYATNPFADLFGPAPNNVETAGRHPIGTQPRSAMRGTSSSGSGKDTIITRSFNPFTDASSDASSVAGSGGWGIAPPQPPTTNLMQASATGPIGAPAGSSSSAPDSNGVDLDDWVAGLTQPSQTAMGPAPRGSMTSPNMCGAVSQTAWGGPDGGVGTLNQPPASSHSSLYNPFATFYAQWQQPASAAAAVDPSGPPPLSYEDAVASSPAAVPVQTLPPPPAYEEVMKSQSALPLPTPMVSSFPPPGREKVEMKDRVCVEVRLPPMRPREAVWPKLLASGMDSLFMAPAGQDSAMMQWAEAEKRLVVPHGLTSAGGKEDMDAAPCGAVPAPEGLDETIKCILTDEVSGTMWTGHRGGKVARWRMVHGCGLRVEPGIWQANMTGDVSCMALSRSGELWIGSEFGTMRVWSYPGGAPGARPPVKVNECRRQDGSKPHSQVLQVSASASGRTIWSTGRSSVSIWDAHTLQCLGSMHHADAARRADKDTPVDSEKCWVDVEKGLNTTLAQRPMGERPPHLGALQQGLLQTNQEEQGASALGLSVMKGVNVLGKFAARMSKVVKQNMAQQEGSGADASEREEGPSDKGKPAGLVATPDGCMLLGFKFGTIEKFSELGKKMERWSLDMHNRIKCMALMGGQWLWVGCKDGHISVVDVISGNLLRSWSAHLFPVISLTQVGSVVFSLAKDGNVRGWPLVPPSDAQAMLWHNGLHASLQRHDLRVLAGTWNVNCSRPSLDSLQTWLGTRCQDAHIVVVGLQEVETGSESLAKNAVISLVYRSLLEKGNQNAQWWTFQLEFALGQDKFERVALRQMSGILLLVFCRKELRPNVGEVSSSSVACGVLGVGGNKGAVAVSMSVFRRRIVVLCSHFAAHQERVEERNADYMKIVRSLHFDNTPKAKPGAAPSPGYPSLEAELDPGVIVEPGVVGEDERDSSNGRASVSGQSYTSQLSQVSTLKVAPSMRREGVQAAKNGGPASTAVGPGLIDADMLVWVGDFNYRINAQYTCTVDCSNSMELCYLADRDQLRAEMAKGNIFHGLSEGPLSFPPTYKFDKGVEATAGGLLPYDSSEKRRVPAWTDRILWRGSPPSVASSAACEDHLEDDLLVSLRPATDGSAYSAVLEVCESDHKPVVAELEVVLPAYVQHLKRAHSLATLATICSDAPILLFGRSSSMNARPVSAATAATRPVLVLNPAAFTSPAGANLSARISAPMITPPVAPGGPPRLCLRPGEDFPLVVSNTGPRVWSCALVGAAAKGGSRAWLPTWMQVTPAAFMLEPGATRTVILRAATPTTSDTYPYQPQPLSFVCELCSQSVADSGKGVWGCPQVLPPQVLQIDVAPLNSPAMR